MAMITDDPNDPATVLRNKIKAQVSPDPATDPTAPVPPAPAPPKQGVTDPAFTPAAPPAATTNQAPAPVNQNPLFKPGQNIRPGEDIPLADPHTAPPAAAATPGVFNDDASILAQIAKWAAMPGADPTLSNDPQYYLRRIKETGGINDAGKLKFWQDASVGPTAFFNNPNRESGGAAAPMPAATSPFTEQVRKMLMERMGRDTAPVNESDSYIAQPFAAANLQAQREQQMERTALAERAAAQGDTSGSVNMGIQQSAERNAVGLGSLKAKLIGQEYQSRRADLNDAMQSALNSGDKETAYALQMALAQLDAQLRREGYGVNMSEFAADQNRLASNQVTN